MGGKAIIPIIGKEAKRFDINIRNNIISNLSIIDDLVPVREIKEKKDFGDIDFLCYSELKREEKNNQIIVEIEKNNYSFQGKITNDNVFSLAFSDYQIDIIFISKQHLNTSYYYFADNDRGNLIGSIYHALNFNYGHQGLYLKLDNTKILLSNDTESILNFLGCGNVFIKKILSDGFDTFEEMYKHITEIPYFSSQYFQFENLNNKNRSRNSKRNTYNNFLHYLKDKTFSDPTPNIEYMKYKSLSYFNKEKEYVSLLKEQEKNKIIRKMISGDLFFNITGLKEKKLGEFIIFFKERNKSIIENIETYNIEYFEEKIKNEYDIFINNQR
jgi:hypothetical protein